MDRPFESGFRRDTCCCVGPGVAWWLRRCTTSRTVVSLGIF